MYWFIKGQVTAWLCGAQCCKSLMLVPVFTVFLFSLSSLASHTVKSLLSYCISTKYPHDDSMCFYPTSIVSLTQIYITHNLTYIRHVLHPEVLTEMQNAITFLIIAAATCMINCVVDSLHYARGRPPGGGNERKRHKRLQILSHIYYPIKLPPSPP